MKLITQYTLFAIISTITNIGSQDLSLRFYSGVYSVLISVFIGTGVGLAVKYALDKRYIFRYLTRDALHNTKTFMLYSVMGVVTTFIFWGFEFGFGHIFQSKEMRYAGGVLGLAIGYLIKYQLDKRFVFTG
jgi:putative flippase GtrA